MTRSRYIVGIDLGTTNCAVAYVDTKGPRAAGGRHPDVRRSAACRAGRVGPPEHAALVPLSHRRATSFQPERRGCPGATAATGSLASSQDSKGPVFPAAWSAAPRAGSVIPAWTARPTSCPGARPPEIKRVSPVEASAAYLRHIRDAWNDHFAKDDPARRLEQQEVVLTVPASFDEAARELTLEAAKKAELASITLLEEPQAAFYCWIVSHQDRWQREVRAGELILVCDIGGGTTDFSLITVVETPTGPGFRRVAVGDHLMLGGDNIDLALAHQVEKKLGGVRLDTEQWSALRFACRTAKEKLLVEQQPLLERWPVTIAGRGSRIIGGSIQSELTRQEVAGDRARWLLSQGQPRRGAAARVEAGPAGVRPAVRGRSGRAQAPERLPAAASGRGDRPGRSPGPRTGPPGPTRSSSTAGP